MTEEIKQAQESLKKTLGEMGDLLKKQQDQIKEFGETKSALATRIDSQDKLITELKGSLLEADKKSLEIEKKLLRPDFGGSGSGDLKSTGETFVASPEFKAMLDSKSFRSSPMLVKGGFGEMMRKAAITLGGSSAGALVNPVRVPGIFTGEGNRNRVLRDLLPVLSLSTGGLEYVRETGFANLWTSLMASASIGATSVTVAEVAGMYEGQKIKIAGQEVTIAVGGINPTTKVVTFAPALLAAKNIGDDVTAKFFAPTAETKQKPEADIDLQLLDANPKTLAHWLPVSRQALADAEGLRAMIDGRLMYGLMLAEEEQLLYGDGTGENLQGILTTPGVQSYAWSSGLTGDTQIDAIRRSMTKARLAEYPVDGLVLNPKDWENIELLKGSDGHYIWLAVSDGAGQRMFRLNIVETTAIRTGEFLTGAFRMGATIYDREQSNIRVSDQHADYFTRNMVAILAEERLALANFRPEAFVYGTFDGAPA